jgi:hypothetical protein
MGDGTGPQEADPKGRAAVELTALFQFVNDCVRRPKAAGRKKVARISGGGRA